ncbi:gas vesicle protein GvpM [Halobacterium wangiae]|uniref:gas vesicle protein GvpM n=1 Tax=Halobacterium wangiae TaxID=2902623 RepID=UPI001E316F88|nr:gas vesicle protein GvpJ [Halobacterium wangiae]
MDPNKERDHAIVDVLDVLLREGAMIQADVLVTVADIPLVGINLQAAVAGMTTMREYGFFENWDLETREAALETSTQDESDTEEGSAIEESPIAESSREESS